MYGNKVPLLFLFLLLNMKLYSKHSKFSPLSFFKVEIRTIKLRVFPIYKKTSFWLFIGMSALHALDDIFGLKGSKRSNEDTFFSTLEDIISLWVRLKKNHLWIICKTWKIGFKTSTTEINKWWTKIQFYINIMELFQQPRRRRPSLRAQTAVRTWRCPRVADQRIIRRTGRSQPQVCIDK